MGSLNSQKKQGTESLKKPTIFEFFNKVFFIRFFGSEEGFKIYKKTTEYIEKVKELGIPLNPILENLENNNNGENGYNIDNQVVEGLKFLLSKFNEEISLLDKKETGVSIDSDRLKKIKNHNHRGLGMYINKNEISVISMEKITNKPEFVLKLFNRFLGRNFIQIEDFVNILLGKDEQSFDIIENFLIKSVNGIKTKNKKEQYYESVMLVAGYLLGDKLTFGDNNSIVSAFEKMIDKIEGNSITDNCKKKVDEVLKNEE